MADTDTHVPEDVDSEVSRLSSDTFSDQSFKDTEMNSTLMGAESSDESNSDHFFSEDDEDDNQEDDGSETFSDEEYDDQDQTSPQDHTMSAENLSRKPSIGSTKPHLSSDDVSRPSPSSLSSGLVPPPSSAPVASGGAQEEEWDEGNEELLQLLVDTVEEDLSDDTTDDDDIDTLVSLSLESDSPSTTPAPKPAETTWKMPRSSSDNSDMSSKIALLKRRSVKGPIVLAQYDTTPPASPGHKGLPSSEEVPVAVAVAVLDQEKMPEERTQTARRLSNPNKKLDPPVAPSQWERSRIRESLRCKAAAAAGPPVTLGSRLQLGNIRRYDSSDSSADSSGSSSPTSASSSNTSSNNNSDEEALFRNNLPTVRFHRRVNTTNRGPKGQAPQVSAEDDGTSTKLRERRSTLGNRLNTPLPPQYPAPPPPVNKEIEEEEEDEQMGEYSRRFVDYYVVVGVNHNDMAVDSEDGHQVASALDQSFKPAILDRYPQTNYEVAPLPPHVWMFCFPRGIQLQHRPLAPDFFFFALTEIDGARFYGACIVVYEPLSTHAVSKLYDDFHQQQPASSSATLTAAQKRRKLEEDELREGKQQVFAPKCICLLSHFPYFNALNHSLDAIYRTFQKGGVIEKPIYRLLHEIPYLPAGRRLRLAFGPKPETAGSAPSGPADSVEIRSALSHEVQLSDFSFTMMLQTLGTDGLIQLFAAALLEQKICFFSSQYSFLTMAAEVLLMILQPFTWPHVYVPILPCWLLDFLHAPTPFIMGLHTSYLIDTPDEVTGVLFVDLDNGKIHLPRVKVPTNQDQSDSLSQPAFTMVEEDMKQKLPKDLLKRLQTHLVKAKAMITKPAEFGEFLFSSRNIGSKTNELEGQQLELEVRWAFLDFFVELIPNYRESIRFLRRYPQPICVFDSSSFFKARSVSPDRVSFCTQLFATQAFSVFIDNFYKRPYQPFDVLLDLHELASRIFSKRDIKKLSHNYIYHCLKTSSSSSSSSTTAEEVPTIDILAGGVEESKNVPKLFPKTDRKFFRQKRTEAAADPTEQQKRQSDEQQDRLREEALACVPFAAFGGSIEGIVNQYIDDNEGGDSKKKKRSHKKKSSESFPKASSGSDVSPMLAENETRSFISQKLMQVVHTNNPINSNDQAIFYELFKLDEGRKQFAEALVKLVEDRQGSGIKLSSVREERLIPNQAIDILGRLLFKCLTEALHSADFQSPLLLMEVIFRVGDQTLSDDQSSRNYLYHRVMRHSFWRNGHFWEAAFYEVARNQRSSFDQQLIQLYPHSFSSSSSSSSTSSPSSSASSSPAPLTKSSRSESSSSSSSLGVPKIETLSLSKSGSPLALNLEVGGKHNLDFGILRTADWEQLNATQQKNVQTNENQLLHDALSTVALNMLKLGTKLDQITRFVRRYGTMVQLSPEKLDELHNLVVNMNKVQSLGTKMMAQGGEVDGPALDQPSNDFEFDDYFSTAFSQISARHDRGRMKELYQRLTETQRVDVKSSRYRKSIIDSKKFLERSTSQTSCADILNILQTGREEPQRSQLLPTKCQRTSHTGYQRSTLLGHNTPIECVKICDGSIVSGSNSGLVIVWDGQTGNCKHQLAAHADVVTCLASEATTLITGSQDQTIKHWNIQTGQCTQHVTSHMGTITALAIHGDKYASGSYDNTAKLWDLRRSVKPIFDLVGHKGPISHLQLSENIMVTASKDTTIKIWDLRKNKVLHTLVGHSDWIKRVYVDRNNVYSASMDHTIRMWDVNSGRSKRVFHGHRGAVNCFDLSPDGRTIASGSEDGGLKLWDVKSGECLDTLEGHKDEIVNLSWFRGGGMIVSGSFDSTVRLWRLSRDGSRTLSKSKTLKGHKHSVLSMDVSDNTVVTGGGDFSVRSWTFNDS